MSPEGPGERVYILLWVLTSSPGNLEPEMESGK